MPRQVTNPTLKIRWKRKAPTGMTFWRYVIPTYELEVFSESQNKYVPIPVVE